MTIEWKSEPSEIVAQMAAEDHVIAMLPQPFVTVAQSKFDDLTIRLDLTKEWDALDNGSQLNTAGLWSAPNLPKSTRRLWPLS